MVSIYLFVRSFLLFTVAVLFRPVEPATFSQGQLVNADDAALFESDLSFCTSAPYLLGSMQPLEAMAWVLMLRSDFKKR